MRYRATVRCDDCGATAEAVVISEPDVNVFEIEDVIGEWQGEPEPDGETPPCGHDDWDVVEE